MTSTLLRFARTGALACACVVGTGCDKPVDPAVAIGEGPAEKPQEPAAPVLTPAQLEQLYLDTKARVEATEELPEASFEAIKADLMQVASEAEDVHLRANASLLLGSLHEGRGDQRAAISFYRQATELIPEEVGTHIVFALALSKDQKWDEAIAAQWKVVNMIPDDLMGWLLLGELHVKGGKSEEAAKVYGAYEMRRKGLLDGLTLKQGGEYVQDEGQRAACAEALVVANDNGTSLGLMYALDSDPSPVVRERVAAIMGEQRMIGYRKLLETKLGSEPNDAVKEAITWAISEIDREPVETAPGPVPEDLTSMVEAEALALAKAAAAASSEGTPAESPGAAEAGESAAGGSAADAKLGDSKAP